MYSLYRCEMCSPVCCSSTACPMVKVKDDWGESSDCDKGDKCTYCHSRMELQFHPDVSLRCHQCMSLSCTRNPSRDENTRM